MQLNKIDAIVDETGKPFWEELFMKKIITFTAIIAFVVMVMGLSGCSKDKAEKFTDSTGVEWRVLTQDENGNKLIITEHMQGLEEGIIYNSTDVYTRLGDSDGLRPALNAWFEDMLAPELKSNALPAKNINNDVRSEPSGGLIAFSENEPAGLTSAGSGFATPENSLFVLSISEVHQYNKKGDFLGFEKRGLGWLRSPGAGWTQDYPDNNTVTCVGGDTVSGICQTSAIEKNGFHPALWISPSK